MHFLLDILMVFACVGVMITDCVKKHKKPKVKTELQVKVEKDLETLKAIK